MKKSELESKFLSVIESFFHSKDPKYGFLAEYLVEEAEKSGMKPPERQRYLTKVEVTAYNEKYCAGFMSEKDIISEYTWEEE